MVPVDPRRAGRTSLGLIGGSVLLFWVTGLLGPSVAQPPLGADLGWPPVRLRLSPEPWLVVGLLVAAYGAGAVGLVLALRALDRGWCPSPRRLFASAALAVAALALVPPLGSADHLSYAAYGRIAAAGENPYAERPVDWRGGTDPVVAAVEKPWEAAPSVYGPLATAEQALASVLGGESVAATVFWLSIFGGLAFFAAGALLLRAAGPDPPVRARAALLWSVNPLLLGLLVAGAHVDGFAVALAVAGFAVLRRSPLGAGALLGAAVGVKLSLALLGVAAAWALRHRPGSLARLAAGAMLVLVPAHWLVGPDAFGQVRRAARYVSLGTPWNLVVDSLDAAVGVAVSRQLLGVAAGVVAVAVAVALARIVPMPGRPDPATAAARAGVVLVAAWLLTAPYSLPWYDAALWAPLALLPASRVDLIAVARTATMALAYVPGRVELPESLRTVTLTWRGEVTPWLGLLLVGWVVVAARLTPAARAGRRPRSAGSRRVRPLRWEPVAGVLIGLGLAAVPALRALAAPGWQRLVDLEVYRDAGLSVLIGQPVYEHLTPLPNLLPFTYPPAAALAAVPLALAPRAAVDVLWTLGQLAVLAWVVRRAFRPPLDRLGRRRPLAAGALTGAAAWLVPVSDGLRFGQVDLALVALCLAGCAGLRIRGSLVGLATAVKLTPGVFLVHLVLAGRRAGALAGAGTAALVTAVAALALPGASAQYWGRALLDSDRVGANAGTSNQSLRGVLLRIGPQGTAGTLLWLLFAAAAAWFGFRAAARSARAGQDVRAVALVGLLAVLLSPVAWIHHLAWVVVALGALVDDGRSPRRWAAAAGVAAFFAVPVPWLGVGVLEAGGPVWLGRTLQQGYCAGAVGLLVALGITAARPRPAR